MGILDLLYKEHRLMKRALNVIEVASLHLKQGKEEAIDPMLNSANFLLHFSVGCHQRKEEEIFFPMLHNRGIPTDILEVMHIDHRAAEDYLQDFIVTLIRYEGDEHRLLSALIWKASGYLWFLRHHLEIEESIFFSRARNLFSNKEQGMLLEQFARWEMEHCTYCSWIATA